MQLTPLRALASDIWEVEMHRQEGLHLRNRMVVVRLPDGALWLHSPIRIDDELAAQLEALGPVRHLVAPNRSHYMFVADAKARWPEAKVWAAPGLAEKEPSVPVDTELAAGDRPWGDELDLEIWGGVPRLNEVVFFHRPSGTMICTDSFFWIQSEGHGPTRCFWRAFGVWQRFAQNRVWRRVFTKDTRASKASAERICAWPIERVAMAHGDVLEDDAHAAVRQAVAWLEAS